MTSFGDARSNVAKSALPLFGLCEANDRTGPLASVIQALDYSNSDMTLVSAKGSDLPDAVQQASLVL